MDDDRLFDAAQAELEHRQRQRLVDAAAAGEPGTAEVDHVTIVTRDGVPDHVEHRVIGVGWVDSAAPDHGEDN